MPSSNTNGHLHINGHIRSAVSLQGHHLRALHGRVGGHQLVRGQSRHGAGTCQLVHHPYQIFSPGSVICHHPHAGSWTPRAGRINMAMLRIVGHGGGPRPCMMIRCEGYIGKASASPPSPSAAGPMLCGSAWSGVDCACQPWHAMMHHHQEHQHGWKPQQA